MPNICNFIPIRLSERAINERLKFIQAQVCYAISAAQSGDVVYTANSGTITFSGTGTQADPLTATFTGTVPTAADPTGTIGLTAVNGSATTYMRSDAAPALSQAIVPSWTGLHTFTAGLVANPSGATAISALNNVASATFPTAFFQKVENGSGVITNAVFPLDCVVMRCNYGANAIKVGQGVNLKFQLQQASTVVEGVRIAAVATSVGGGNVEAQFWNTRSSSSIQSGTMKSTGQWQFNQYLTSSSFTGTPVGHIAFDSAGNLLTVAVPTTVSAANPTAVVGLTAVNGSAATFMRSDAAPALDQGIAPTWTATHTFSTLAGTGVRMVTASATGVLGVSTVQVGQQNVVNTTTTVVVTTAQSGTVFTNNGGSTTIEFTLPAATVGLVYEFVNLVGASSRINLKANGTDTIGNLANTSIAGGIAASTTQGDSCKLVCYVAGKWQVLYDANGDWQIDLA